jgi:hypothetical protein
MQDGAHDTPTKTLTIREADQIWDRLNDAVDKAEKALEHPCAKEAELKDLKEAQHVTSRRHNQLLWSIISALVILGVPAVWWAASQDAAVKSMSSDVQGIGGDLRGVQERVQRVEVGQGQILEKMEQERKAAPAKEQERLEAIRAVVKDAVKTRR